MKLVILAFGSRGDVQPVVALACGLQSAEFDVTVAAGSDFKEFVEGAGLPFAGFSSNMQDLVNSDAGTEWLGGSDNQLREIQNMRRMINTMSDGVTHDMLRITQDADVIVSGLPLFMTAHAIAEKFNKKHITLQLTPLSPTKNGRASMYPALPKATSILNKWVGYISEYALYWVFKDVSNAFRQELGLEPMSFADYARAYNQDVPVIYGVSEHVINTPDDWNDNSYITGYWFYDAPSDWIPSQALVDFLADGDKPIYIGFGSMANKDPQATVQMMLDALAQTGKRGIIYSGWAGLQADELPDDIFLLDNAPHDWLFPQMEAVIHHGGAGTTSAAIRAGVPSTIVWHMGDQPYWGRRVYELGMGSKPIPRNTLTTKHLVKAINQMTESDTMHHVAQKISKQLNQENGVEVAVRAFQTLLG